MTPDEREVLERAIRRVTEQAANADTIVDEAMDAGLDGTEPFVVNIKRLRADLLSVKADLEGELEREVLDCVVCGRTITTAVSASKPVTGRTPSQHRTRRRSSRPNESGFSPANTLYLRNPRGRSRFSLQLRRMALEHPLPLFESFFGDLASGEAFGEDFASIDAVPLRFSAARRVAPVAMVPHHPVPHHHPNLQRQEMITNAPPNHPAPHIIVISELTGSQRRRLVRGGAFGDACRGIASPPSHHLFALGLGPRPKPRDVGWRRKPLRRWPRPR